MEGSSTAFDGQDLGVENDDPFAGAEQEFQQGDDPFGGEEGAATEEGEAPLVDREGEPVERPTDADASDGSAPSDGEPGAPTATASDDDPDGPPGEAAAVEAASSEEPGAEAGSDGEAAEPKPKKGDTRRAYRLLVPEGPGKYAELAWYEKGGKMVAQGTSGAKKQTVVLAADNEAALAHGFEVLGSPSDGCSLVAVTTGHFRVRKIKPKPIPVNQRLSID